jgi:hypothetical protein
VNCDDRHRSGTAKAESSGSTCISVISDHCECQAMCPGIMVGDATSEFALVEVI